MLDFNRFGNMTPTADFLAKPYLCSVEPFRIAGNLHYVGNMFCSSHLVDTGEGLIILDTPAADQLPFLVNSIWKAGFDPRDIKYIIVSHAHVDHYGSVAALVNMTGAKTCMSDRDSADMRGRPDFFREHNRQMGGGNECFTPDIELHDGQILELGNTKIRCVLTPGHTIGTMSHFWDVEDRGKILKVGIYGGAGFITLSPKWWLGDAVALSRIRSQFVESIDKVWDERVDIMLGNHPFHNDILKKRKRFLNGDRDAFIDPSEWKRFLQELKNRYGKFSVMTQQEIDVMYSTSQFEEYQAM